MKNQAKWLFQPMAAREMLAAAGVNYDGDDPEAAALEWLGNTPVDARHMTRASVVVMAWPELAEHRTVIAQVIAKLEAMGIGGT